MSVSHEELMADLERISKLVDDRNAENRHLRNLLGLCCSALEDAETHDDSPVHTWLGKSVVETCREFLGDAQGPEWSQRTKKDPVAVRRRRGMY